MFLINLNYLIVAVIRLEYNVVWNFYTLFLAFVYEFFQIFFVILMKHLVV